MNPANKKRFRNEGSGKSPWAIVYGGFSPSEKFTFPMFRQVEKPTTNVKPGEDFKSLLKREADSSDDRSMKIAYEEYMRVHDMIESKRKQVVSNIGVDENLTDNKLNVFFDHVMDVAGEKSKEGSNTTRDAWLSNSDKSFQGTTRITMNPKNKKRFRNEGLGKSPWAIVYGGFSPSEKSTFPMFRQAEKPTANIKPDEDFKSLLKRHADSSDDRSMKIAYEEYMRVHDIIESKRKQVVSNIGVDENLTDNKLNIFFDHVMDVAGEKSKEGSNSDKFFQGTTKITMNPKNKKRFRNEGLGTSPWAIVYGGFSPSEKSTFPMFRQAEKPTTNIKPDEDFKSLLKRHADSSDDRSMKIAYEEYMRVHDIIESKRKQIFFDHVMDVAGEKSKEGSNSDKSFLGTTKITMNPKNKKRFRNEGLGKSPWAIVYGGFSPSEKSTFSMFRQAEKPTANIKPDEDFKSLLKRHADSSDDHSMKIAYEEYMRVHDIIESKRKQVVSNIGVDENLTDNKLNIFFDHVMDVAGEKSKEGSNSDKSFQGTTKITMNPKNKKRFRNEGLGKSPWAIVYGGFSPSEKSTFPMFRQAEKPTANIKPDEDFKSLLKRHADSSDDRSMKIAYEEYMRVHDIIESKRKQVVSNIGVDENLTDNKLNIFFDHVMDVAGEKSKEGSNSDKSFQGTTKITMNPKNKKRFRNEGLGKSPWAIVYGGFSPSEKSTFPMFRQVEKPTANVKPDENFKSLLKREADSSDDRSMKIAYEEYMRVHDIIESKRKQKEPSVDVAINATQSDSKDVKSGCPENLIHQ